MEVVSELPLTEECHHYDQLLQVPWDIQKYWQQRYSIFSAYDDGIQLTDDAWFGVTPEPVATQIAADMAAGCSPSKTVLVDLFAGAGGNVIAFALSGVWTTIVAIERDAATLACAQHNAAIYGVADRIVWVHGDCFDVVEQLKLDPSARRTDGGGHREFLREIQLRPENAVVFASPPWGGVGYRTHDVFDLSTMEPYSLGKLHEACRPMEHALYLPRTSDLRQLAKLAPAASQKLEVVQYCMEGAGKAMVAYIPA